ncbi:hypothetical protein CPB86DRAFT_414112 [Serendipita vermifera]|nr:hypothetical protein CPB86DRAFT_414112 [Serendipita vermifera]
MGDWNGTKVAIKDIRGQGSLVATKRIPPATKIPISVEPSGPILELWDVLNGCWNVVPQRRPSVYELEEFVVVQRAVLVLALNDLDG